MPFPLVGCYRSLAYSLLVTSLRSDSFCVLVHLSFIPTSLHSFLPFTASTQCLRRWYTYAQGYPQYHYCLAACGSLHSWPPLRLFIHEKYPSTPAASRLCSPTLLQAALHGFAGTCHPYFPAQHRAMREMPRKPISLCDFRPIRSFQIAPACSARNFIHCACAPFIPFWRRAELIISYRTCAMSNNR